MTHLNLASVLDDFGIKSFDDFRSRDHHYKKNVLSRLRSAADYCAKYEMNSIINLVDHENGLKMCFNVTRNDSGVWTNIPNEVFAKKLALFTSRTVVTFPFNEISPDRGDGAEAIIRLLCNTGPFLRRNYITILPSDLKDQSLTRHLDRLRPANFTLDDLNVQFQEKATAGTFMPSLYLPHVADVKSEEIIRIREEEKEYFNAAELVLQRKLMHQPFDDENLICIMQYINISIGKLHRIAHDIQDSVLRGAAWRLVVIFGSAVALLFPKDLVALALAAIGTSQINIGAIMRSILNVQRDLNAMAGEQFYVYWKINNPDHVLAFRALLERCLSHFENRQQAIDD
ncbi:hypothetical protein [Phaeospirillum tilakii]|uniref:Uncharacterized protein n=1 Tax=Phaeospirillum tilakii TaxID=741673 RepID=A0ABW5CC10_9PROT